MKTFNRTTILLILTVLSSHVASAQKKEPKGLELRKNTISGSVGLGGLYANVALHYDRLVPLKKHLKNTYFLIRGSYGFSDAWLRPKMNYGCLQFGLLAGKKHHFECSLGTRVVLNPQKHKYSEGFFSRYKVTPDALALSGNIGWRYQKPGGRLMLRSGIGTPEAVYVGVGLAL